MLSARIPLDLLQELEKAFPQKCPEPNQKIEEIFHYAGQAGVVRYLRHCYEQQQETEWTFKDTTQFII